MRARTSASQACGSMSLSFAVPISVYMNAARSPPRSEPANSHAFAAEGHTAQRAFGGVVGQADTTVVEEPGERGPVLQHIVDRTRDRVVACESGTLGPQPLLQVCDERDRDLPAHGKPLRDGVYR